MSGKITASLFQYNKGCLLAAFIVLSLSGSAQRATEKNEVLRILSYTTPGFLSGGDSATYARTLQKHYSLVNYLYSITPKDSLSAENKKFIDSIQLYIAKRYVAEKALEKINTRTTVTSQDVQNYYNNHKEEYAIPATCTFIQGFIFREEPAIIEKAKKQMLKVAANPDSIGNAADLKNADYGISIERNLRLTDNAPITKHLQLLKVRQMSELVQIEGYTSKSILYILEKTEKSYHSFEEVKEDCRTRAKAEKTEQVMQQLMKEAVTKYPVPR